MEKSTGKVVVEENWDAALAKLNDDLGPLKCNARIYETDQTCLAQHPSKPCWAQGIVRVHVAPRRVVATSCDA